MRIIRAGEHIQHIPGYGMTVRESGVAVAAPPATGWWTVAGKTCVAAYQPKGAADIADSYVNLANPGTYNAAPGTAPTFAAATGWTFDAASSQYLVTGITPTTSYSVLIRLSSVSSADAWVFGSYTDTGHGIQPNSAPLSMPYTYYYQGAVASVEGVNRTAGVWGLVAGQGYFDGSADGAAMEVSGTPGEIYIADISGPFRRYFSGIVSAMVIYSDTLTAGEVATVSAAMAAL